MEVTKLQTNDFIAQVEEVQKHIFCSLCNKTFAKRRYLNRHTARMHVEDTTLNLKKHDEEKN